MVHTMPYNDWQHILCDSISVHTWRVSSKATVQCPLITRLCACKTLCNEKDQDLLDWQHILTSARQSQEVCSLRTVVNKHAFCHVSREERMEPPAATNKKQKGWCRRLASCNSATAFFNSNLTVQLTRASSSGRSKVSSIIPIPVSSSLQLVICFLAGLWCQEQDICELPFHTAQALGVIVLKTFS